MGGCLIGKSELGLSANRGAWCAESLQKSAAHWDRERWGETPSSPDLQWIETRARRSLAPLVMGSLLSLLRMHWHEPPLTRSRDCGTTLSPSEGERDGVRGFMGSLHGFAIAHCGHEPALRRLGRAPQFVATTSQRRSAETPLRGDGSCARAQHTCHASRSLPQKELKVRQIPGHRDLGVRRGASDQLDRLTDQFARCGVVGHQ